MTGPGQAPAAEIYQHLVARLRALGPAAVAFSGGVDSSLLLYALREAQGEGTFAITARTPLVCSVEAHSAAHLPGRLGVRHLWVDADPLERAEVRRNQPDRCYHCKRHLLEAIRARAVAEGYSVLLEGSNRDDAHDYRPGSRAVRELGVLSPLAAAGLTKEQIRALARARGLENWAQPALACLASRIPVGEEITPERLQRIDRAEEALRPLGFREVRVRDYGSLARIEVESEHVARLLEPATRTRIVEELKAIGYRFLAVDLEGYRQGAMNAPPAGASGPALQPARALRIGGGQRQASSGAVIVEGPFEIRIAGETVARLMITPGNEIDLAAGFLYATGILDERADLAAIDLASRPHPAFGEVTLGSAAAQGRWERRRDLGHPSGGGIGVLRSVEHAGQQRITGLRGRCRRIFYTTPARILEHLDTLTSLQVLRRETGGAHAMALFDEEGQVIAFAEDVARSNALDKVVGRALRTGRLSDCMICVASSRASFEIAYKAARAELPILATVSAPTSLALEVARSAGMTLVSFLREGAMRVYAGEERIVD
ncbi:MAG: ATP-dependent sacrificial sulfur transferase LarE [Candidatus Eisenbacteria sp.]|nr:ATP-dependent sacrificial sulfur transferase LarE [Candidatus Eisenbacteria bacterium]